MGLSGQGLERFAAVAASQVGDRLPGLVALVAHGDEVHVEAIGTLDVGGRRVERASLFRIASTTKPITAAATLALVGEGLLDLDEPVDRLLPELANRRVLRRMDGPLDDTVPAVGAVTVRGLLTFTFGFGMAMEMFTVGRAVAGRRGSGGGRAVDDRAASAGCLRRPGYVDGQVRRVAPAGAAR